MSQTMNPKRPSSKNSTNVIIGLVISVIVGAILAGLLPWAFYELNPIISLLIMAFQWPNQDLIIKVVWYGFTFIVGFLLAMAIYFLVQRTRAFIARRRRASNSS
jgi:uncharacterized membrane protein